MEFFATYGELIAILVSIFATGGVLSRRSRVRNGKDSDKRRRDNEAILVAVLNLQQQESNVETRLNDVSLTLNRTTLRLTNVEQSFKQMNDYLKTAPWWRPTN